MNTKTILGSGALIVGILFAAAIFCIGSWGFSVYNTAVVFDEDINEQWADVGVALQRRADLYQSLLSVVDAGSAQELAVFETLRDQAAALSGALDYDASGQPIPPNTNQEAQELSGLLESFNSAFNGVLVYLADNPDQIASIELYRDFQVQIEGTENRISVERMRYNEDVGEARTHCRLGLNSIICGLLGFSVNEWVYFSPDPESFENPELEFSVPGGNE